MCGKDELPVRNEIGGYHRITLVHGYQHFRQNCLVSLMLHGFNSEGQDWNIRNYVTLLE